jgi:hypothetical protein
VKQESLILSTKYHALMNTSEAKEHSMNNAFPCEEKQAIQTSNDISEAHEAFYKATLKRYKRSANIIQ